MKNILLNRETYLNGAKTILLLLVVAVLCSRCIKVPSEEIPITLSVSTGTLNYSSSGGQQTFYITSNDEWRVGSTDPWLLVSTTSGSNNYTVTVTADANTSITQRIATIIVRSDVTGVAEQTINATQAGMFYEPEMVFVQGGTFTMGCTSEQGNDCYSNEIPAHQVTLSSFNIGKYPVTQEQWLSIMNNIVYLDGNNLPVDMVSWNDIVGTSGRYVDLNGIRYYENGFIYKLNLLTGKNYRLPTEAEWEFAARGGTGTRNYKYSGSNTLGNVAWYADNSGYTTHVVGTKLPNELGIYDMSGNVFEWCSDWLVAYNNNAQNNPRGISSGTFRVLRGGNWGSSARGCRISDRSGNPPNDGYEGFGFRLVLPL